MEKILKINISLEEVKKPLDRINFNFVADKNISGDIEGEYKRRLAQHEQDSEAAGPGSAGSECPVCKGYEFVGGNAYTTQPNPHSECEVGSAVDVEGFCVHKWTESSRNHPGYNTSWCIKCYQEVGDDSELLD